MLDTIEGLQAHVEYLIARAGRGAVGIAITSKQRTLWAGGFGVADPEAGHTATERSYWRAGSIGKSLIGLAAQMLEDRSELCLNDTVDKLVPEVPISNQWGDTHPVRVAHLLEHTSGIADLTAEHYASNDPTPLTLSQGLHLVRDTLQCQWPPGTRHSYSNVGPAVAAYIVQKVDGRRIEEFLRDEVFEPAGMSGASLLLTDQVREGLVAGFDDQGLRVPYHHLIVRPPGALNVTPLHLARLARLFLGRGQVGGRQLLTADSVDRMEFPRTLSSPYVGCGWNYGLGVTCQDVNGVVYYGHSGGVPGYCAEYRYAPDLGLGYCAMVSFSGGEFFKYARIMARTHLLERYVDRA